MACSKKGCKGCYKCGGHIRKAKGGWLDSYQDGGEVKPYVAKDKADFDYRNQMYNDSLFLHNQNQAYYDFLRENVGEPHSIRDNKKFNFKTEGTSTNIVNFDNQFEDSPFKKAERVDNIFNPFSEPEYSYTDVTIPKNLYPVYELNSVIQPEKNIYYNYGRIHHSDDPEYITNSSLERGIPKSEVKDDDSDSDITKLTWDHYNHNGKDYEYYWTNKGSSTNFALYKKPTQKVYPPSEEYPNTTSGEFDREITRMPKPTPKPTPRPAIPEKMRRQDLNFKILDNVYTFPTRNLTQEKVSKVMNGDMMDKYVRPNTSNVRSDRDYASANLPGKSPRGMSREEYNQYFLEKKNGGWIDSYEDGGKIEGDDKKPAMTPDEIERFIQGNKALMRANTPAAGTAEPMVGIDDPVFNAALFGAPWLLGKSTGVASKPITQVFKGSDKKGVDAARDIYTDYLSKPLKKELEPYLSKKAVIKGKEQQIMDSFLNKPTPNYTKVKKKGGWIDKL